MLGDISKKYESGKSGPGTISSGAGDPGGKSYGSHQLAIKTGTLQAYVEQSKYLSEFTGKIYGSASFDTAWKQLAAREPEEFEADQREFIKRTHYDPVRDYADSLRIDDSEAINEALFSIGVQHGKWRKVVDGAYARIPNINFASEEDVIHALYDSRRAYVVKIALPESTRKSLLNRYVSEERDVINLCQ